MPSSVRPPPQAVVITGGSSGIGRAAAHEFSRSGASVVLAARDAESLEEAARECLSLGARAAIAVPTDVCDPRAVDELARRAVLACGRIDVWVNDAGVTALGRFEDTPPEAFRQVMETNFFGCVHGARAALRVFRAQRRGVLINVASVLGTVGEPYASAYASSKFAIRGFTESLRQELRGSPGIQACAVLPMTMDTPIFRRAANYTPWQAKAVEPVYDPAVAAHEIVRLARQPRAEQVAGRLGHLLSLARRVSPRALERLVGRFGPDLQFLVREPTAAANRGHGNLFHPAAPKDHAVSGGWRMGSASRSLVTNGWVAALGTLLLVGAARHVFRVRAERREHRLRG